MHRAALIIAFFFALTTAFGQHDLYGENRNGRIKPGAEQTDLYFDLLKGKRVALLVNQTSRIGEVPLPDTLLHAGISIVKIFAPEHGFRGDADAGARVAGSVDPKTGIPIVSLYGKKLRPSVEDLKDVDLVVYDIQDVGCRFYTFVSTLHYLMEACAANGRTLLLLDRPDPNGYVIDGPVLDPQFKSFVGVSRLPVIYALSPGEYAELAKGENWFDGAAALKLQVIPCLGYRHKNTFSLKVDPSPNLRSARAVFLYPSLCFFEGTDVSVGRGTDFPFEVIGGPDINRDSATFSFVPQSGPGAANPPFKDRECHGFDLRRKNEKLHSESKGLNLSYLLKMYALSGDKEKFFSDPGFFDKLAGTDQLRKEIVAGKTEQQIRAGWQAGLEAYKAIRKKYLLYPDFE